MFKLDPTISLGSVLTGIGVILTMLGMYWHAARRLGGYELQIQTMWTWWLKRDEELKTIVTTQVDLASAKMSHDVRAAAQTTVWQLSEHQRGVESTLLAALRAKPSEE